MYPGTENTVDLTIEERIALARLGERKKALARRKEREAAGDAQGILIAETLDATAEGYLRAAAAGRADALTRAVAWEEMAANKPTDHTGPRCGTEYASTQREVDAVSPQEG